MESYGCEKKNSIARDRFSDQINTKIIIKNPKSPQRISLATIAPVVINAPIKSIVQDLLSDFFNATRCFFNCSNRPSLCVIPFPDIALSVLPFYWSDDIFFSCLCVEVFKNNFTPPSVKSFLREPVRKRNYGIVLES